MRTPRIPGTGILPSASSASAFGFLIGHLFFGPHADLL
jgi:hypothetical protein